MRLIKISEVMYRTGLARSTVYKFIKTKGFPKQVSLGSAAAWVESEVDDWIIRKVKSRI